MENQNKVLEQIDCNAVVFIIGNTKSCYVFNVDRSVIEIKHSLITINKELKEDSFKQINNYTLINTRYFISKDGKQKIKMKDGSIHKVFRRQWKDF